MPAAHWLTDDLNGIVVPELVLAGEGIALTTSSKPTLKN
jgi:hypothetical protein